MLTSFQRDLSALPDMGSGAFSRMSDMWGKATSCRRSLTVIFRLGLGANRM